MKTELILQPGDVLILQPGDVLVVMVPYGTITITAGLVKAKTQKRLDQVVVEPATDLPDSVVVVTGDNRFNVVQLAAVPGSMW